jgi:hypothetical protein
VEAPRDYQENSKLQGWLDWKISKNCDKVVKWGYFTRPTLTVVL